MELEVIYGEIERVKAELGSEVVILVHHYQRDEVIRFADFRGDSLQRSRVAAEQQHAGKGKRWLEGRRLWCLGVS